MVAKTEEAEHVMEEGQEGQEGQEDGPVYTGMLPCSVLLLRRQQIRRHCGGARGDGGARVEALPRSRLVCAHACRCGEVVPGGGGAQRMLLQPRQPQQQS